MYDDMIDEISQGQQALVHQEESSHSDNSSQSATSSWRESSDHETSDQLEQSLAILDGGAIEPPVYGPKRKNIKKNIRRHQNAYLELFNNTIIEATGQDLSHADKAFEPPSQIGASTWTSFEKEVFFRNVSTLGRDKIKEIASAIESKSETEVHRYMQLLDEGIVEGTLTHNLEGLVAADIPAATEISEACEDVLEAAADDLAQNQLRLEQSLEESRYGDYWLLDEGVAEEVEKTLAAGHEIKNTNGNTDDRSNSRPMDIPDDDDENVPLPVPSATLLNLSNWLELARHFMWQSQDGSDNWIDYTASKEESPSIYHTAFQDFHNLTVSLTRRIVQASIFQAQSRLRIDQESRHTKIYSDDVRAAERILGLRKNKRRFWGTMPRRHGIKVYIRQNKPKQKSDSDQEPAKAHEYRDLFHVPFDELEAKLGVGGKEFQELINEDAMSTVEDESGLPSIYDDSDMWTEVSFSGGDGSGDSDNEVHDRTFQASNRDASLSARSKHKTVSTMRDLDKQMDYQAESFDNRSSAVEEARLWSLFNLHPPFQLKNEDLPLASTLHPKRRTKADLKNWHNATDYQAEWERGVGQTETEEFVAMQKRGDTNRKRRRLEDDQRAPRRRRLNRQTLDVGRGYESSEGEDSETADEPRAPSPVEYHSVAWPAEALADAGSQDDEARAQSKTIGEMIAVGTLPSPRGRSRSRSVRARSTTSTASRTSQHPALQPKQEAPEPGHRDEDVAMEDADDAQSESSQSSDESGFGHSMVRPQPQVRNDTPDTESDGWEEGAVADVRRSTRPARVAERRERRMQRL